MVRLQILSGKKSGAVFDDIRPPFVVGRSTGAAVLLDDAGVWPEHCKIQWLREGIILEVQDEAIAAVNGESATRVVLRNGDLITLGGVTLRFNLSPLRQSSLALREWLTWIGVAILCLAQVAIIYWLTR